MTRRFRVPEGRTLTIPVEMCPAPGALNHLLEAGAEIEVDEVRATRHGRFINNRIKLGDLVELAPGTPANPDAPPSKAITPPGVGEMKIDTGMQPKKEG